MPILGTNVRDPNFQLRFFAIVFMGVMAFGAVLYWRSQLMLSTNYVDIPIAKHLNKNNLLEENY